MYRRDNRLTVSSSGVYTICPAFPSECHEDAWRQKFRSGGSSIYRGTGGDFGNSTRTKGVSANEIILCICELGRGHNYQCVNCFNE